MCMIELKKDLKETTFAYMQATFAYVYDRGNYKNDLKETTFAYLQATFAYRICKQRLHICMIEGTKKKRLERYNVCIENDNSQTL